MQNQTIRTYVRHLQDVQKMRIQSGNRIVAFFRNKIGVNHDNTQVVEATDEKQYTEEELLDLQSNSEAIDAAVEKPKKKKKIEIDYTANNVIEQLKTVEDAEDFLEAIRKDYKRVTDGIVSVSKRTKTDSKIITSYGELILLDTYDKLLKAETNLERVIEEELKLLPIWNRWLGNIRGIGPVMGGILLSEVDIEKCHTMNALHTYAGLDVVFKTDKQGNFVLDEEGNLIGEGRSRKEEHLVPKTYYTREGKEIHTRGITFNPLLKTKLIGVLGTVFIKLGGEYKDIYNGYKARLENHPKHKTTYVILRDGQEFSEDVFTSEKDAKTTIKLLTQLKQEGDEVKFTVEMRGKTARHRHNMAVRYMIKEFLSDFWVAYRVVEGLPIRCRYEEEKLGIVHSKPNRMIEWLEKEGVEYPKPNYQEKLKELRLSNI